LGEEGNFMSIIGFYNETEKTTAETASAKPGNFATGAILQDNIDEKIHFRFWLAFFGQNE
jgi:hypothetical protein